MQSGCGGGRTHSAAGTEQPGRADFTEPVEVNPRAFNHFVNGAILEVMGELYMAREEYHKASLYYPASNEIRYSYAMVLWKLHQFDKVIAQARAIEPKDSRTWLLLGNAFAALGREDSSIAAFVRMTQVDSSNIQVFRRLVNYYQEKKIFDSVILAQEHIVRLSPDASSLSNLAGYQLQAGHYAEAIESYRRSLETDSSESNMKAYLGLALAYGERGQDQAAIETLEAAERRRPFDLMILDQLYSLYQETGDENGAIRAARQISQLTPNDHSAGHRLALAYLEADSLDRADSIFAALREEGDESIVNHYYSGRIALVENELAAAREHFVYLTETADSLVDGWLNLGLVYRLQDSVEREVTVYEQGLPHLKNGDDSVEVLFSMGAAFERLDRFDRAVAVFENLIEISPDNSQALNYLGYMLADRGVRLDYARELILRALEIMPENGAFLDSHGWVLYRMGQYEKALAELMRAYRYLDSDPVILEHIGDVHAALGETDKALEFWNKALRLDPENESLKNKVRNEP